MQDSFTRNYSPKEICSYFSSTGFEIKITDLQKPTASFTQGLYEFVIRRIESGYSSGGGDSLSIVKLVQYMGQFLEGIGIQTFTVRDLIPDSKRLNIIMNRIMGFLIFKDTKKFICERIFELSSRYSISEKELNSSIESIYKRMAEIDEMNEKNKIERIEIKKEIEVLGKELKKITAENRDRVSEIGLLKNEKTELCDKLSSCQLLEYNFQQELSMLKKQIVSDPKKLMELVDEMKELIVKEKDEIKKMERIILVKKEECEKLSRDGALVKKIYEKINECRKETENREKQIQTRKILEGSLRSIGSQSRTLKIKTNHIIKQIEHLETKINTLKEKDKAYSEEMGEKIVGLKGKYSVITEERNIVQEKIEKNNRKIKELLCNLTTNEGTHKRDCSDIIEVLVSLSISIEKFFSEIRELTLYD